MKNQDLFIRKIIAVVLLVIGFAATDIIGQQNMTAKIHPSDGESAKKVEAFVSQWDKNDLPGFGEQITPLVDYHTHIFTVEAYARLFEPLLPPVELPEHFARLLRERDAAFNQRNPSAMAEFYTKDALFLRPTGPNWLRGERAIAYVAQNLAANFRAVPVTYADGETTGYIAGYWTIGEGEKIRYASNFLLSLKKESDGKWRIAAESITIKGPPVPEVGTAEQLLKHLDAE